MHSFTYPRSTRLILALLAFGFGKSLTAQDAPQIVDTQPLKAEETATGNSEAFQAFSQDAIVKAATSNNPGSQVIVIETSPEAMRMEVIRQFVEALEKSGQARNAKLELEGKPQDYHAIITLHRDLHNDNTDILVETLKSLGLTRMMFQVNPDPSAKESSVVVVCPTDVTWRRVRAITQTLQKLGDFKVDVRVAANNDPVTSTMTHENAQPPVAAPQGPASSVEPRAYDSERPPSTIREPMPADDDTISLTIKNSRGSVNELRDHQKSLDLKTQELAAQLREPFPTPTTGDTLQTQLRVTVQEAFEARQELQRVELAEFARRLQSIQRSIEMREKISQQIIDRRVAELLDPNLKWDAVETSRQATQPKIASDRTSEKRISSAKEMQQRLQGTWDVKVSVTDNSDDGIGQQTYQAVIRGEILLLQSVENGRVLHASSIKLVWNNADQPNEVDAIYDPNDSEEDETLLGRISCDGDRFQLAIRLELLDGENVRPGEICPGYGIWYIDCARTAATNLSSNKAPEKGSAATTRTLSIRLLGDRKLSIADPSVKNPSPQPFTGDGFSLRLPLDRPGFEKGYHIVNDQFESMRAVVRLECSDSMSEEFWRRLGDQSIDISIAHSDFVSVRSGNLVDRVVYLPLTSSGGNEIQTKSSGGIGRPFDLVGDIRKFSGQPIVSLRLDPPTAADQVAQSHERVGPAFSSGVPSSGEQEVDEQEESDSSSQRREELVKKIPESGTALVMFDDGSENSRQMLPVARTVTESTSTQLIERPLAAPSWIAPAAGTVKRGKNVGSDGPQFVLIKDRQQVAVLNGLLTEKRLREFVRTADNWLTPHGTGVKENSLVRIDCYINPGNGNAGKQTGHAHPLTTAVVAVFEDQALLLGPDSISEYLDKGFSCVAIARDESGQQIQLPLDIVHVGPVPLLGRDNDQKKTPATASFSLGDDQKVEVPVELSGYPASATAVLGAYETGSAIYHIRGAFGLSSVQLAEIDYVPEVGQSVLSGGFYRDRQSLPKVDFGSPIQWQSQLVQSNDGSIYGANLNGAEMMDVICPSIPASVGFTFSEHGRLIGKYGLGHPTEKDMTHSVLLPVATHSVLHSALGKIEVAGLKAALVSTLAPQLDEEKVSNNVDRPAG